VTDLAENPRTYGLDSDSWWPNQQSMIEPAIDLEPGRTLIIEAPTGTGKSFAPATVSYFRPGTTVLCSTRDLQAQYRDSFPDFAVVWGQEHYPCLLEKKIEEYGRAYGEQPTRADCMFRKPGQCPRYDECPYESAKRRALTARAKVLNYAYAFYTNWWRESPNDLFCDEAHRVSAVLSGLVSVEIADSTRRYWGFSDFPFVSGSTPFAYKRVGAWAAKAASTLDSETELSDPRRSLRARRLQLKLEHLANSLYRAQEGDWFVASGQALGKLLAKPVVPGKYAKQIVDDGARTVTLMSATIGDPEILAGELELDHNYEFITLPHIFPPENRVVIWVKDSPKLSYKSEPKDYAEQARIIGKILESHKGQKGLIHTVSWSHTKLLAGLLSRNGHSARLYVPEGERVDAIEKFKASPDDLVALSPSWHEGLNFPDDEARFAIIAKIPFLSLGDPVVKLRLKRKDGTKWYQWQASLKVVQAAGRIVRHAQDWGVVYICDSQWPRVARFAPKWFEVETL